MKKIVFSVVIVLTFLLFFASLSSAQVHVRMRAIRASNVGESIDPSLKDVYTELKSLFNFTSYRLLRENSFNLSLNQPVSISPRPELFSELTLVGHHRTSVELRVKVARKGKEILNTQVRLPPGRIVFIGGPRLPEGVIIYAFSARF